MSRLHFLLIIQCCSINPSISHATSKYIIAGVGDSTIQYMFSTAPSDQSKEFYSEDPGIRYVQTTSDTITFICAINSLMGKTLYGTHKLSFTHLIEKMHLPHIDTIIFNFGTVDVLCHIKKQMLLQQKPLEEVIVTLVYNYIENILHVKTLFHHSLPLLIICAVMPPIHNCHYLQGDIATGVIISQAMNKILNTYAEKNNILFWNPYIPYIDEDGTLRPEYAHSDCVHFDLTRNQLLIDSLYSFMSSNI